MSSIISSAVNQLVQLVGFYDHGVYICKTCHSKVKKNKVPCQAVSNKLSVKWLPREFRNPRRLETLLVARRILFKKVTVMPKGQSPKVKGSICNIPISDIDSNCNSLPRSADTNGVIVVKLQRKVEYHAHVLLEPVRPRIIESSQNYLKLSNDLYRDIEIDMKNLPEGLLNLQKNSFLEENIFNYIVRNIAQPIDIATENQVIEEEHR